VYAAHGLSTEKAAPVDFFEHSLLPPLR